MRLLTKKNLFTINEWKKQIKEILQHPKYGTVKKILQMNVSLD